MTPSAHEDGENVGLAQDDVIDAVELDLVSGVLSEEHPITRLDDQGNDVALFDDPAGPHRDDFGLLGLFLRGFRDEQSTARLLLALETANEYAVVQGTELDHVPLLQLRGSMATPSRGRGGGRRAVR